MRRHPLVPSLSLACALAAGCAHTPALPPGAQAPDAPHPGTIALHHAWNGSTQTLRAQDFPASFVFRCADARGEPAERARAAWCVPVVEIESVSVDGAGHLVAPADAVQIESTTYGPGHRFLDHTRLMRNGRPPV
ncbi:hypothetical protein BLA17378_08605 [Burkholderia aenigmatica]|uniref:Lipoprotein n=2 Tax=Burkholderia TaxID=32008 RepID=A0ABY6Y7E4_9BURK|nr:hypothetical protein [Burkholderia aenigmatica]VWD49423.1 hypothetical protein BLA17378_08605 [Burkholderia aenigmatica]VWD60524.1 hypothetical protein BLA18628_07162 [Burkholderia aenigmatica]